jgi:PPOX class probable F420-dependent enzyme
VSPIRSTTFSTYRTPPAYGSDQVRAGEPADADRRSPSAPGDGRMATMDLDEARSLIREQHHAVLATTRADGTPQLSPITATVDDAGRVVISTRETAYKVRNLRRDPHAYLCVLPDTFYGGRWIQVDGTVSVIELPDAMEPLVDYYRQISGEHPDWDDYRAAMVRDRRVLLRLEITRAGPDRAG